MHDKGLLDADTLEAQAKKSLDRMHGYGWDADTDVGHAFGYFVAPDATATKYANDHGRFDVRDRLCGYSYAAVDKDGRPIAVPATELAQNFAIAPGGAPAGSIDVINDDDPTGPPRSWLSVSKSTGRQDYDLDGAICLRGLLTGQSPEAKRVQAESPSSWRAGGSTASRPLSSMAGTTTACRSASRRAPIFGLNDLQDGQRCAAPIHRGRQRRAFGTDLPGFDTRMVPLTLYHLRALDLMWDHLTKGAPLPNSQVLRTTPRGGEAGHAPPFLHAGNVPPMPLEARPEDRIAVEKGRVTIPE